jgi:hypothetical protein
MLDGLSVVVTVIVGLLLRFGIPLGLTGFILFVLTRLDETWQAEAEQARRAALSAAAVSRPPCWEVRGCPPDARAQCAAFQNPGEACWQVMRTQTGRLPQRCLACQVFRSAPILHPQIGHI